MMNTRPADLTASSLFAKAAQPRGPRRLQII